MRIDHLDGPRFDFINGSYYGAGSASTGLGSGGSYAAQYIKRRTELVKREKKESQDGRQDRD